MVTLTYTKVLKAIPKCYGIYSNIAKMCGVSRSAITLFLQKEINKDLIPLIDQERERLACGNVGR